MAVREQHPQPPATAEPLNMEAAMAELPNMAAQETTTRSTRDLALHPPLATGALPHPQIPHPPNPGTPLPLVDHLFTTPRQHRTCLLIPRPRQAIPAPSTRQPPIHTVLTRRRQPLWGEKVRMMPLRLVRVWELMVRRRRGIRRRRLGRMEAVRMMRSMMGQGMMRRLLVRRHNRSRLGDVKLAVWSE
jgi:hypothetical protein